MNRNEYQQTDQYDRFLEIQHRSLCNLSLLLELLLKDNKVIIFDPFSRTDLQGTSETIFSSADIQIQNGVNFITNQMGLLDVAKSEEYEIYIINDMGIPYIMRNHRRVHPSDSLLELWRTGELGKHFL